MLHHDTTATGAYACETVLAGECTVWRAGHEPLRVSSLSKVAEHASDATHLCKDCRVKRQQRRSLNDQVLMVFSKLQHDAAKLQPMLRTQLEWLYLR